MFKKFLIVCVIALGILYGSGSNLSAVKRQILGVANEIARSVSSDSDDGWGIAY